MLSSHPESYRRLPAVIERLICRGSPLGRVNAGSLRAGRAKFRLSRGFQRHPAL